MQKIPKINFDPEEYKKNNGKLQAIIFPDGSVIHTSDYAISLMDICCVKYKITLSELIEQIPEGDALQQFAWLCNKSNCVCVSEDALVSTSLSEKQVWTLQAMKDSGLYLGNIPYKYCN